MTLNIKELIVYALLVAVSLGVLTALAVSPSGFLASKVVYQGF